MDEISYDMFLNESENKIFRKCIEDMCNIITDDTVTPYKNILNDGRYPLADGDYCYTLIGGAKECAKTAVGKAIKDNKYRFRVLSDIRDKINNIPDFEFHSIFS